MLNSFDVKFIFDRVRLGLFSSSNILQIEDVALLVVFFLFLPCCHISLETSEMSVFTTKTTQPRPQVFSVNVALTCKKAGLLTSSVD